MSGYCLECGNDLCICSELEEEAKRQPDVVFICQRKEIKKLQEQNKNLEYESKKKDLIIENLTVFLKKYQNCEDAYTYREIQNEIYLDVHDYLNFISRAIAREALAKVNNENN